MKKKYMYPEITIARFEVNEFLGACNHGQGKGSGHHEGEGCGNCVANSVAITDYPGGS